MIGKYFSNVDSLIKKHFRKKRPLLVKILVGQALLIGLLTFFCLTRDSSNYTQVCKAPKSITMVCDFFKNLLKANYHYQMVVGFLMWVLECKDDEKQEIKIISTENLAVDDDVMIKIRDVGLLLILLVVLTILMILVLLGKSVTRSEETILRINTEGDWEYSPSKKREAAVKF